MAHRINRTELEGKVVIKALNSNGSNFFLVAYLPASICLTAVIAE